ncbi:MAG TPA: GNAT family N-acetyltransferase [Gammaproteobacteria bacterium]|jgi:GNAT superfamily N-acetyltransferase
MPSVIRIRRAVASDIPAIREAHLASIRALCADAYTSEQIDNWTSNRDLDRYAPLVTPRFHCLVAADNAMLGGFGTVDLEKSEISSLFMRPEYAGAGLAGSLLQLLEDVARRHGLQALSLESTVNARSFYLKNGYQIIAPAIKRFSTGLEIDCFQMQKPL